MASLRFSWKQLFAAGHDVVMAGVALLLALVSRYGIAAFPTDHRLYLWLATFMALAAIVFRLFGLARGLWRFASTSDFRAIALGSAVTILAFLMIMFVVNRLDGFPRTTAITTWFAMVVLLGGPRLAYRMLKDGSLAQTGLLGRQRETGEQILVIGTAGEADALIRASEGMGINRPRFRGIIDDSTGRKGREVRTVPVLGDIHHLEAILDRLLKSGGLDAIVVATRQPDKAMLTRVAMLASRYKVPLRRVVTPPLQGAGLDVADVALEDLLGRSPVSLDLPAIRALVADETVLITGAGGSIGSEITRQVAALGPRRLILLDHSEFALYEIDQRLSERAPEIPRLALIADLRDRRRIGAILQAERPALVFHAAALKHVPLVEANVCEAALTNVVGTQILADACVAAGVAAMVMISTDKAIRPASVMGATKRAAEAYCQALDDSTLGTRFITVRFGNVLGSTGSVVPLFARQIRAGGPVTVTHPHMKRYFMTVREATELVLQAAAHALRDASKRGRILVLDMGEPMRIVDLARTMISLAGLRPDIDIPIVFTEPRPGEKLFEELFDEQELATPTLADGVRMAATRKTGLDDIRPRLEAIEQAALRGDDAAVRAVLRQIVPDFQADPLERPLESALEGASNVVRLDAIRQQDGPAGRG